MSKRINDYDVLYKAVQTYVENRGGNIAVIGGIEMQHIRTNLVKQNLHLSLLTLSTTSTRKTFSTQKPVLDIFYLTSLRKRRALQVKPAG